MGYPSVVWQQQMEKANIITYDNTHSCQKPIRVWVSDNTTTFTRQFRPIPLIDDYNPTYIDPDYGTDPYWDNEIYNQDLLQFLYGLNDIKHFNPPIPNNKKTRALIENWQMNDGTNHLVFPNPLRTEDHDKNAETTPQSLVDEKQFKMFSLPKIGNVLPARLYTAFDQRKHQMQEAYVVFPNGLWGTDYRRPYRHGSTIQYNS